MKINYVSGPQSLDIRPSGLNRSRGVEVALKKLLGLNISLEQIIYADDMLSSLFPFHEQGAFLMCPSNAQEEVKKLVQESGGFVSQKRSTEAVAEFLTEIYPNKHRNRHKFVHSIYLDKDGVIWEAEKLEQNLPFFKIIADYIRNCEGPYTSHPPISIATGAARESVERVAGYIGLNGKNIPAGMQWPPVIFEEGCLAMDPITGEILDLTEEEYGLFSADFRKSALFIKELGEKIIQRVPRLNDLLGHNCKIIRKEKSGFTLDLPLEARGSREKLRLTHSIIYRNINDLIPEDMEFAGLFAKKELES